MDVQYYRKMKYVDRLTRHSKHRSYNLLEHSYMVAVLFRKFAAKEDIAYDMQVFDFVLHHDIVEVVSSDLPYDVKNLTAATKKAWGSIEDEVVSAHHQLSRYSDDEIKSAMSQIQYALFKACDLLDLWLFLKEEEAMGNKTKTIYQMIDKCETLLRGKFISIDKFIDSYVC